MKAATIKGYAFQFEAGTGWIGVTMVGQGTRTVEKPDWWERLLGITWERKVACAIRYFIRWADSSQADYTAAKDAIVRIRNVDGYQPIWNEANARPPSGGTGVI